MGRPLKSKKNPNDEVKSTDEVKITDEVKGTDGETKTEDKPRPEEALATVPPSQPQKAPSQVLRPTLRRNETSEPDQHLVMLTIKRELLLLQMFAWVTASLCVLTKIALSIANVFFLSLCLNWKHGREFMRVVGGFWKEPAQASYSRLKDSMFPSSEIDKSYHVTFKVTDSSFTSAAVLFEVTYPLLLRNPAMLSLVVFSLFATYYLLSFVHELLRNVISAMNARLHGRALPPELAHQPQSP